MNTTIRMQSRIPRLLATLMSLVALVAWPSTVQATPVGGTATNFTVKNRATGLPLNLTDFAGKIVVLDFFAYWCGPCQASSPDLETNVQQYYAARGGNAYGVPVQVLAISIDNSSPSQTDAFVAAAKLELVAEDPGTSAGAWYQFGAGYIPHFVIINGVAGSPSHTQWKVLYSNYGYPGAATLRASIDTIQPAPVPEIAVEQPSGTNLTDGSASINFGSVTLGTNSVKTFTIRNPGTANLTGLAVTKDGAHAADFSVSAPGATSLTPGGSTTFTATFAPGAGGSHTAAIHITSNDADESPFDISLTGTSVATAVQTWRLTNFGNFTSTGDGADLNDYDKDGIPNLLEFAFGLNPKLNSAGMLPQAQRSANTLTISFTQPTGVSGITYGAEWSPTLTAGSWTAVTDTGSGLQHTFSVPSSGKAKVFMRLKVSNP